MGRMGDSGPVEVEFRDNDTDEVIAARSMPGAPIPDDEIEFIGGNGWKVERRRWVFEDASSGTVTRTNCKARVYLSVIP